MSAHVDDERVSGLGIVPKNPGIYRMLNGILGGHYLGKQQDSDSASGYMSTAPWHRLRK